MLSCWLLPFTCVGIKKVAIVEQVKTSNTDQKKVKKIKDIEK